MHFPPKRTKLLVQVKQLVPSEQVAHVESHALQALSSTYSFVLH